MRNIEVLDRILSLEIIDLASKNNAYANKIGIDCKTVKNRDMKYQWLTTKAKKVGGPKNLVGIIAGVGALAGIASYKGGEFVVKKIKNKTKKEQTQEKTEITIYSVTEEGISNEGLELHIGDKFRVLETDKDAVLVEIIGNDNNPYFVSAELLKNISNYK